MASTVQRILQPGGLGALWVGLLAGPVAWAVHLMLSYVLAPHICALGGEWALHLVTAATLLVALVAALVAWRSLRATREAQEKTLRRSADRAYFMAKHGLWMSAFSAFIILVEALPVVVLPTCA